MFIVHIWEILQILAELHSSEDVFLTPKDGIFQLDILVKTVSCKVTTIQNDNDRK